MSVPLYDENSIIYQNDFIVNRIPHYRAVSLIFMHRRVFQLNFLSIALFFRTDTQIVGEEKISMNEAIENAFN
jgi:hypothetical protein